VVLASGWADIAALHLDAIVPHVNRLRYADLCTLAAAGIFWSGARHLVWRAANRALELALGVCAITIWNSALYRFGLAGMDLAAAIVVIGSFAWLLILTTGQELQWAVDRAFSQFALLDTFVYFLVRAQYVLGAALASLLVMCAGWRTVVLTGHFAIVVSSLLRDAFFWLWASKAIVSLVASLLLVTAGASKAYERARDSRIVSLL